MGCLIVKFYIVCRASLIIIYSCCCHSAYAIDHTHTDAGGACKIPSQRTRARATRGCTILITLTLVCLSVCLCVMDVTSTNHARLRKKTREDCDVIALYFDLPEHSDSRRWPQMSFERSLSQRLVAIILVCPSVCVCVCVCVCITDALLL